MKFVHLLLAAMLAAVALSGCGEGPSGGSGLSTQGGSGPTPAPVLLTPPPGSIYLGAYVNPLGVDRPDISLLTQFEQQVGRKMALSPHYYGFYDPFPGAYETDDAANGRIPLDSWDCQVPDAQVAAGDVDGAIRSHADAIRAFGKPIFLRYFWEMNIPATKTYRNICWDPNTDLPNGQFSPQYYIAAWDHIRAIFAQEGVGNVIWLWNPDGDRNPSPYFPGAGEVDWTGFDFYDTLDVLPKQLYFQAYNFLLPYGKPIMVGETGAQPSEQAAFFPVLQPTLQQQFPSIKGYVYFDSTNRRLSMPEKVTWVIDNSNIPAFAAMATNPYMSAFQP